MSDSVISNVRSCIVCGSERDLHRHHIFFGTANRQQSEKYGCWCYLCQRHHNMPNIGVHFNRQADLRLKRTCQEILERDHGWSRSRFIQTFGRNYL